jgi:predicted TIM-barrel fold metal-dependent hydrolase
MSQLVNVARKESRADLPADVSFIDCDTHFLVMSALESLAKTYPNHFQLTVDKDVIKFLYEGRVIHRSRKGEDIVGSSVHGRLDLDTKVEDMNKEDPKCIQVLGFDQNVLISMYPPGIGADVCRALNDGVIEMLERSKYRDRFIPVSAVYFPWVEEAVREIRRTHDLGFKGIFLTATGERYQDFDLSAQSLWPIYEALNELNMPIIYHSSIKAFRDWTSYNLKTINLSTMVGTNHPALRICNELGLLYALPFTYACDIASLIFSRTFDEFPNLRICTLEGRVPSYVPALMDSLDQVRWKRHKIKMKPSEYFNRHIYPGGTANEKWLHHTIEAWPEHNIVVGSDYPHADASGTWPNSMRLIQQNSKLSETDKYQILVGNARRLFGY